MQTLINPHAIVAAGVVLLTASSNATVIFNDTFDSGTGSWFTGGSPGTLSNSSGQLSWNTAGTGSNDERSIGRSFDAQTINVGETIRVTLDYTQNAATASDIIRVGLYNTTNAISANQWSTSGATVGAFSGYYGFIRDNGTTSLIRSESATDGTGTASGPTVQATAPTLSTIAGTSTFFDIVQGTSYRLVFELTRTSSTVMSASYTLSSGSTIHQNITGSTSTALYDGFDALVIRPNGPVLLDNIEVSVIPEPSAALLGGLGWLALLVRRR